ncbi:MAG: hypothetical protein R6W82_11925 [bacterium]
MDPQYLVRVLLSFLVAGVWITGSTWLAERMGSRIAGLIANLPSKLLVTLVFLAVVHDPGFAVDTTRAVPMGMTINAFYLFLFVLLLPLGLPLTLLLTTGFWAGMAVAAERIHLEALGPSILLYLAATALTWGLLEFTLHIPAVEGTRRRYGPLSFLYRGLFAGTVVAATVFISAFVGTYWTGLFSTFPAVMLTTMTILTLAGGPRLARATGKVMLLASTNIIVFSLAVIAAYPRLGVAAGTLLSFLAAALWVWLLNPLVRRLALRERTRRV